LVVGGNHVGRRQGSFKIFRAGEDAGQRVVVLGRNRVELVVVAAGTRDGQPQKTPREGVDPVIQLIGLCLGSTAGVGVVDGAEGEEAEGRHAGHFVLLPQQVSGNLLADELGVGLVRVERANHPVPKPIAAGIHPGRKGVGLVLRIAGDVEPVAAPALAVAGTRQQLVDEPLVSVGGFVCEEAARFFERRRQPG
jgi:hypothetical protein